MIIQQLPGKLRLITQEQHALLSGLLAHAWRGTLNKTLLHGLLVHTAAMHDNPWRHVDEQPKWNPDTGRPYDFISIPNTERVIMYGGGIDQLERVHPYMALLVSLHYTSFAGTNKLKALQDQEERRRQRLKQFLPKSLSDQKRWQRDLSFIQLFDSMSLFVCMTMPEIEPETVPNWIDPLTWARDPESGTEFSLDWLDGNSIIMTPFPLANPINLHVYFRELPQSNFASQKELNQAWHTAIPQLWTVSLNSE